MSESGGPGIGEAPVTSTRDPAQLRGQLEAWVGTRLPSGADPRVPPIDSPGANGWSSETLLFDVTWNDGGAERTDRLVARVAPDPTAMPVFPHYDMPEQARVMGFVAEHTSLPLPTVRWVEPDASVLGEPFFVMDRVDGLVPPDIPPYDMGGWIVDCTAEDRARLSARSARVLAELHPTSELVDQLGFLQYDWPGDSALRRHFANERHYWKWIADGRRSEIVERVFTWLEAHWPAHEGPPLLSWGDARIGNLMYRDFEPVAVLDWEMAAVAPRARRGLDELHALVLREPVRPLRPRRTPRHPPTRGGLLDLRGGDRLRAPRPRLLRGYSAMRHLLITLRINLRRMHFGELVHTEDLDSTIDHVDLIEDLLTH